MAGTGTIGFDGADRRTRVDVGKAVLSWCIGPVGGVAMAAIAAYGCGRDPVVARRRPGMLASCELVARSSGGPRILGRNRRCRASVCVSIATVDGVFRIAALIPSPPVLVPELCGGAPTVDADHPAARVSALRDAVLAAGRTLAAAASRWTIVGVGEADRTFGAETTGTFRGFGADVRVGLADPIADTYAADADLPLAALVGGWVRGRVAPSTVAEARVVAARAEGQYCAEVGAKLRRELDASPVDRGVLVVADGAATLSTQAPGYLDPRAEGVQRDLDRALTAGDRSALSELDAGLCAELEVSGRAAYQVLAGLFEVDGADPVVDTTYAAAPFGVGYHVSVWRPGAAS